MPEPLLRPKDVPAPAWFGRFNFQREGDVARLTAVLTDGPQVVLLSGEAGIGRRYLLQAAVHRMRQAGGIVEILEIDLEGYDEEVDLGRFIELQVEKRRKEKGEARGEIVEALVSAMRLGVKGTGWASLLSMTLSLKEPVAALRKLFGNSDRGFSGELFSAREVFASFVGSLSGKVILHVIDPTLFHAIPSPENPRRWLPEVVERFPHATLVISCGPDDQEEDLVPGARRDVERIDLGRLDEHSVRALLDLRLAPNAFPPDLAETLMHYSHGLPGLLGSAVWLLEREGALDEDGSRVWRVDDVAVAEALSEGLLDPVSQAFHEHPEHTKALWVFLLDAALCGDLVPVSLLVDLQVLDKDTQDELLDLIDEELVAGLGLLEDLEYTHPGFPASVAVARFREPIVRLAILEHFPMKERKARAARITPALRRGLPVQTRVLARLFVTLADHLGEADRAEILRDLAWWVGTEEADSLRDGLVSALAEGQLKPESLWGALEGTKGRWPSYRRLALLDAYGTGPCDEEGNPLGVPVERQGEFHFLRAQLLEDLGRYQEALGHAQQAVRILEAQSETNSLWYLEALLLAGSLSRLIADYVGALRLDEQALGLAEKIVGPEHPLTLKTKNNLALVLKTQGNLSRARKIYEEVLEAAIRVLGPGHLYTNATRHNLIRVCEAQGDLSRAKESYEEVLKVEIRARGSEHPTTLTVKSNLAGVLREQGEFSRAREIYKEILETRARVLGPEHCSTLVTKSNLAGILKQQGDLSQARAVFEEVLEVQNRVLGPEQADALATKVYLALTLRAQGDLSRAQEVLVEVLEVNDRVYGLEHFSTLVTKSHLAGVLKEQRDLPRAREMFEEVLEARLRALGPEHPATLTTKNNLAGVLETLGELSRARDLYEEVLEARISLQGAEYPDTLTTKHGLAGVLEVLGELPRARQLYEEVLEMRIQVQGPEHPHMLATKHDLARILTKQGEISRASEMCEKVLEERIRLQGPEHPETLNAKHLLAHVLAKPPASNRRAGIGDRRSGTALR
jgi:tetratricopeptide (TPR) repeat protein